MPLVLRVAGMPFGFVLRHSSFYNQESNIDLITNIMNACELNQLEKMIVLFCEDFTDDIFSYDKARHI